MLKSKKSPIWLLAPLILLLSGIISHAASNGVRDDAHFFSANAIQQANQVIQQIDQRHQKDLLIETVPTITADKKDEYDPQNKNTFFQRWADERAQQQGVNGVYILICKDPSHLQVEPGNKTRMRLFTLADRDQLSHRLLADFRQKQFDQGLMDAVQFVQQRMDTNSASSSTGSGSVPRGGMPTYGNTNSRQWSFGGVACLIIGIVLLIVMIRGIFGRSGGGYYGGSGGYYPPQGGAYPPGGYYGGGGYGGGGGFGRGFLGGLLGGAVGGYAAQQWTQHQQGGSYTPPASGGYDPGTGSDTSFSAPPGGGGDFGDAGGGGGGGGNFGGGGGGGDFGGGGGGGGDSGGSGGGDF